MLTWQKIRQGIVIFDGAMGTMLQQAGLKGGECPEAWNLDKPEYIKDIHKGYLEAGAMVIETNTFGASPVKLKEYGLENKTAEINKRAAQLAQGVAGGKALVAGSVGPTGLMMEPFGPATFEDFYQAFAIQVGSLAEGGVDLILFETMSDLSEIRAGILAAKENTKLPIFCSMTFDKNGRTLMGIGPETAAYVLEALGVDAIGANCSTGPKELLAIMERMAAVTSLPLIAQPNAGLPILRGDKVVYDETPANFGAYANQFVQKGVGIIGGCCGTTPEHIRQLSRALDGAVLPSRGVVSGTVLSSRRKTYVIGENTAPLLIGGSLNLELDPGLKTDLEDQKFDGFFNKAISRIEEGAQVILFNTGALSVDPKLLQKAIMHVQSGLDVPVAIKADNGHLLTEGLKVVQGKALLVVSLTAKGQVNSVLGLAKKYGALVLAILPEVNKSVGRNMVSSLVLEAQESGFRKSELLIGYQVLEAGNYRVGMQLVHELGQEFGLKTCLELVGGHDKNIEAVKMEAKKNCINFLCY
jgi:5-methyltetrahydrofolate--homocysteine methyltransferase